MKGDNVASALPRSPTADEVTMVAVYSRCLCIAYYRAIL